MKKEINHINPLNIPEIREEILKQLSLKELNEISDLIYHNTTPSQETWYKWNKVKNEVLSKKFPKFYFDPSDLNEMN